MTFTVILTLGNETTYCNFDYIGDANNFYNNIVEYDEKTLEDEMGQVYKNDWQ